MALPTRGLQAVRVETIRPTAVAPSVTVNCALPFAAPGVTAVPGTVTTAIPVQPGITALPAIQVQPITAPAITAQPIVSVQPLVQPTGQPLAQAFAAAQVPGLAPQVAFAAPGVAVPAITPAAPLTLLQRQQVALTCLAGALGTTPVQLQTVAAQMGVDPITLATTLLGVQVAPAAAPGAFAPGAFAPGVTPGLAGFPAGMAGLAAIDPLAAAALAGFPGITPGAL